MEKIINANNLDYLKTMEDNSIDAVVTDPPYGIAFMQKKWDYNVPSVEFWEEIYRVLKPGGHILSFGGTRTFHRLTVNIEDAGFVIRDTIVWHYGQGFPKSHNISKNLDKKFGAEREVVGSKLGLPGYSLKKDNGYKNNSNSVSVPSFNAGKSEITAPATDEAKQWDGWGTALKPATELICLAQKPISEKTIVDNVLKWGVGGLNIDGCRNPTNDNLLNSSSYSDKENVGKSKKFGGFKTANLSKFKQPEGRWPANLILSHHPECIETDEVITLKEGKDKKAPTIKNDKDKINLFNSDYTNTIRDFGEEKIKKYICHNDCPLKIMDEQSGYSKSTKNLLKGAGKTKNAKVYNWSNTEQGDFYSMRGHSDEGGASRFFYCPKPSPKEKQEGNTHPTVKPIKLMEYLIKMVTPPNGIVLDPFGGSGTTALAAKNLNLNYILIEMDKDYCDIINNRIKNLNNDNKAI